MQRRDPEIVSFDRRSRKEEEIEDIEAFLAAYERATGASLEIEEIGESPDAICRRRDGSLVGIEHTRVRRPPANAHWDAVLDGREEMDAGDSLDDINERIRQKAQARLRFRTASTILMIALYESDFVVTAFMASDIPVEDLAGCGFEEIWLADFKGIRDGAHREVRVFGLYPPQHRRMVGRSLQDQKPYG